MEYFGLRNMDAWMDHYTQCKWRLTNTGKRPNLSITAIIMLCDNPSLEARAPDCRWSGRRGTRRNRSVRWGQRRHGPGVPLHGRISVISGVLHVLEKLRKMGSGSDGKSDGAHELAGERYFSHGSKHRFTVIINAWDVPVLNIDDLESIVLFKLRAQVMWKKITFLFILMIHLCADVV